MLVVEQCDDALCGRPFSVMRYSVAFAAPGQTPGIICCPHCGAAKHGLPNRVYIPSALPAIYESWHHISTS